MATFNQLAKVAPQLLAWGGSVELISAPGRGKSTFASDLIERLNTGVEDVASRWGFAVAFLGTYTPVDLLGFMIPAKDPQGGLPRSTFTVPAWMQTRDGKLVTDYRRGILLLDEFGQSDPDVKKSAADLFLNKRIGPHVLPPGWVVWACSNRSSDRSGVTKSYDFVINRRMEVHITDDLESLLDWMAKNRVHPTIQAFCKQNPQVVFTDGVPDKQGPWATPRSVVQVSQLLTTLAGGPDRPLPMEGMATELVSGLVGPGSAGQIMAFVKLEGKLPTWEQIVSDPKGCKLVDSPDAQMLVCYSTAAKVDENSAQPVIDYIERLPKEFGVTFAKAAVRRDPNLVNTKAFTSWCSRNASLMASVVIDTK